MLLEYHACVHSFETLYDDVADIYDYHKNNYIRFIRLNILFINFFLLFFFLLLCTHVLILQKNMSISSYDVDSVNVECAVSANRLKSNHHGQNF